MRLRSGISALATLAVLVGVITTLALSSFTAEAQGDPGAVANLQLTSTTAGELTVSWDAASPTPTDYRVDWAKSTEGYQSWKVNEGHVYPTPDATTTTITDLGHDTEYKIRMRARYYRGEHEGKSWGGPWATATITVNGEPAETPTPEPVKEEPVQQQSRDDPDPPTGTIDTITAADDDAGQLLLTWTAPAAPNATPTDYHINWAKSTEEYPANTASAGNDHPTSTTHTLAGLKYDIQYNIRVRARYSDGENTDSPWNGPWTETTAQVKLPLPTAPFIGAIAVSPDGDVLLSWFNLKEDDSITGYQILRGPDAENLVVIEDDTGSSSTSYTDTAPPAGQTHTYAVKARNASGLSPLSNTLTATVPEALITARHESTGNTLVSNLGQTFSAEGAIAGIHQERYKEHAIAFTTGANPLGYHVTTAQLTVKEFPGKDTPNPDVSIRADDRGVPGETVLYTLTATSAVTGSWNLLTFTTTDNFTLRPNTTYWLYATAMGTNTMLIRGTESDVEDTESNTDWRIGDARYSRDNGGTWTQWDDFNLWININGHAAPEFLVSNLDSPSTLALFSRRTDADRSKFAQAFSAANNENGTPAEFDFDGVTVQLESAFSTASQLADSDIVVTVHKDSGGQPGDLVYTLTSPETYTVPVPSAPVTFSAPPGSILSSGITYWVKFEIADASTFFTGLTRIDFEFATDNNQVQGPTTYNRWTIGHDSLWSPQTLSWATDVNSIKISVLGAPHYDTLVSNIDQTFLGAEPTGEGGKAAQSFLTPPGPLGQQYRLHRVDINAASQYPTQATIDLHADNNGIPGDHLVSMSMPGDFAPGEFNHVHLTAIAPIGTLLNPGTRYWIVITNDQTSNLLRVGITASKAQDPASLDFWTIDDFRARKEATEYWGTIRDNIQMELLGTPFIRTNEADGPDLPGAGHNAHKTTAVVTPGIVSTGHLTPGLDRNHGLYGDYWWLDTKTGHSYRIEVKFSDSQNNDTGGSAWMSFIDPDHDDYPYASGCCEADHNRDDGHTFVHFRRPTDDWNNRYLVHIAAFDKLNHNSRTYNGPYTITMTDITGTEKVATNLYLGTRIESTLPTIDDHIQYAVSFTTGDHPGGYYKLDRVRMQVPDHQGQPDLVLHTDTSGLPGDGICDLLEPNKVQHHRPYAADNALPVPFRAAHCGRDAVLAASTTYWLVLEGDDYETVFTDSNDQQTRGSGWTIGDRAAINLAGSWESLTDNDGTIPVEIWASSTPPPNRHAAGVPLVHGERRVGETLTADITGITDPEGLSDPRFTYSWIRGDGVDEESITGEESDTYTLTDDDAGERIKTLVTFYDDDEEQETAVGPATSLIAPAAPRILVSNFNQTGSRPDTTTDISSGFVSGAHPHGYAIDSIVFRRAFTTPASSDEAEFRLYTSTSDSDARERKPDTRIMTVSGPNRVNSINIWFNPQSRVKLEPSTTYHVAFTTRTSDVIGCEAVIGGGEDSSSLAGFDILDRYYVYPDWATGLTNDQSCTIQIEGFELASSNLVQSVEFTSSPIQPDMYATGELIEATATLNQAVAFDGPPPVILLQIGDNERRMEYFTSESTDTSWVFLYRVVADDRDDEGVSTKHNALRGYADADLSHYGITNDRTRRVNAAPRVVSQRVSSTPLVQFQYGLGEKIQFTVEFSLPVTVVGNPQLEFSITEPGPDNEFMSYESGSGTRELVFSYTVVAGDNDDHGIEWDANSLQLVDGVDEIIGTYNGLDAILDHTALNQLTGHRIRQNPQVVSQEVTSDPAHGTDSDTYGAGDAITFEMVFNQAVTVTGAPRLRFSIGSRGLAADRYAAYVNGSGTNTLVFSYTVLAADADTDGIYLYDISGSPFDYPDTAIDTIVGTSNNLATANSGIGNEGRLPGHKIDGTITN